MNFVKINDSNVFEGYSVIKKIDKKLTSKGSYFLDLTLADKSGEINAKLWDYKETPQNVFNIHDLVKVRGTYVPFNDQMQFRIDRIRLATEQDEVNISDYVPSADEEGSVMLSEIEGYIASFNDEGMKALCREMIKRHKEQLLYWPAAKNLHHAIRAGLLMHTLSLVRIGDSICKIYPFVNRDLLLCGAILHDISKISELKSAPIGIAGDYTVKGNLLGHLVMGAMEIDEVGKSLGVNEETLTLLEHMLISHHGKLEFGAAKLPMFLEAELLSEIDLMDARVYEIHSAVSAVNKGEMTAKQWALDNRTLYNHGI